MTHVSREWSQALVSAAKAAGLWDATASLSHRCELLGERLGYSGRHVQRWVDGEVNPPNGKQREKLLGLLSPRREEPAPQKSDVRQLPTFDTEAERRAATLTILYFAQQLGPQLVDTVDRAVQTLLIPLTTPVVPPETIAAIRTKEQTTKIGPRPQPKLVR